MLLDRVVRRAGFAVAALVVSVSAASAQTFSFPPPSSSSSWQGLYLGAGLGGRWGNAEASGVSFEADGFRFSGFTGYNWQQSNFIYGIEVDLGGASNSESTVAGVPGFGIAAGDSARVDLGLDVAILARLGLLLSPNLLAYVTGGISFLDIEANVTCSAAGACAAARSETVSDFRTGWTLGAGLEAKLSSNWIVRGEYRYADYGKLDHTFFSGTVDQFSTSIDVDTHTATVGIIYKF